MYLDHRSWIRHNHVGKRQSNVEWLEIFLYLPMVYFENWRVNETDLFVKDPPVIFFRTDLNVESKMLIVFERRYHFERLMSIYSSHQGITVIKARACSYVWWPELDSNLEARMKYCAVCHKMFQYLWQSTTSTLAMWV